MAGRGFLRPGPGATAPLFHFILFLFFRISICIPQKYLVQEQNAAGLEGTSGRK